MVPATLHREHVHDQAPVEGLERQKRSDERIVAASRVKDVAPENGSTTSRHAERNDVVDAQSSLQRIGRRRMIPSDDPGCGDCPWSINQPSMRAHSGSICTSRMEHGVLPAELITRFRVAGLARASGRIVPRGHWWGAG